MPIFIKFNALINSMYAEDSANCLEDVSIGNIRNKEQDAEDNYWPSAVCPTENIKDLL